MASGAVVSISMSNATASIGNLFFRAKFWRDAVVNAGVKKKPEIQ